MSQSHPESDLPPVSDDVLLDMVHDELNDPTHQERWGRFAKEQPILAQEMAKRAFFGLQSLSGDMAERQELRKIILDEVSYAVEALTKAQQQDKQGRDETDSIAS